MGDQADRAQPPASAPLDGDQMGDLDDLDELRVSRLESGQSSGRRAWLPLMRAFPPLRRVWRASGVVALIALVTVVWVAVAPHLPRLLTAHRQIPATSLAVSSDLSSCLVGSSWSRDGRQIAAVASNPCAAAFTRAGAPPNVLIFDAMTGKRLAEYQLDAAVDAALARIGLSRSSGTGYDVSYFESSWSPDDQRLAVEFGVYGEMGGDMGVAIVTLAGAQRGHVSVMLASLNDATLIQPGNGFALVPIERRGVADGSHTTIYLQPALAYRWLPADVLVAAEPLSSSPTAAPPSATATADGAADGAAPEASGEISMWQSGAIAPVTAVACGSNGATVGPLGVPYALLTLTAPIWSPDGRYLLDAFVQARLPSLPGHPGQSGAGFSPCDSGPAPNDLPSAPFHDKGLRTALGLLDAHGDNQLTLAWSPDGQRLAVATLDFPQNSGSLVIYDCATGEVARNFSASDFEAGVAQYSLAQNPVWSPDGRSLLLTISRPDAKVIVLGPQALGG